jgi:hypothetical protein
MCGRRFLIPNAPRCRFSVNLFSIFCEFTEQNCIQPLPPPNPAFSDMCAAAAAAAAAAVTFSPA